MDLNERVTRLKRLLGEQRITRGVFLDSDAEGREVMCLLSAVSPEVAHTEVPEDCPADVMPTWLAHLTVAMTDKGSEDEWKGLVERYVKLAEHWHVLHSNKAWDRVAFRVRQELLRIIRGYTTNIYELFFIMKALELCTRGVEGAPDLNEITIVRTLVMDLQEVTGRFVPTPGLEIVEFLLDDEDDESIRKAAGRLEELAYRVGSKHRPNDASMRNLMWDRINTAVLNSIDHEIYYITDTETM